MYTRYCLDSSPTFEFIELKETASTNDFLRTYRPPNLKNITLVTSEYQVAGRGQRGNSWESAAGKNLLFSLLISPLAIEASRQFIVSQAISLSLKKALDEYTADITIKWPNDIYWQDKKIAGILIENDLTGREITRCVIGVGLNINQETFLSSAPNPISLRQITGKEVERRFVLELIIKHFDHYLKEITRGNHQAIATEYHQALYRKERMHLFSDKKGEFTAQLKEVEPSGRLILTDQTGKDRAYLFKEVEFILP